MIDRFDAEDLADFVARLFAARGMSEGHARQVADVLVWADLRGTDTHGVSRIPGYSTLIDKGELDPTASPKVRTDFGAIVALDSNRAAGPVAVGLALDIAMTKARQFGIGMGLVGNTTHTGAIGFYVETAAKQGFAAIMLGAGPPLMAYQGARVPSLSTAPIAMAVPGGATGVILLDMATSVVSNGRIKMARQKGEAIPEGWALDAQGRSTTDATQAETLLPLGGAKGAGLALMNECLTGVLAGAPILSAMLGPNGKRGHWQNATIICIDIARFRSPGDYEADIDAMAQVIKALPALDGAEPIRLPGERGTAEFRTRATNGIPIGRKTWQQLVALAGECGVKVPNSKS